ncbi:MAG: stalk domain-containing protein [Bacillota bacterium]
MSRIIGRAALLAVLLIVIGSFSADGAGESLIKKIITFSQDIKLYIDNRQVSGEIPLALTEQGKVMVPAREVFQALGMNVVWDGKNQAIHAYSKAGSVTPAKPSDRKDEFSWLEDMTVIRNVGPFFRQQGQKFMLAAGGHQHGIAVALGENKEAEVTVRTDANYRGIEGWLGVEDETMNSSGAYVLTIYADGNKIYESKPVLPATYPHYVSSNWTGITSALTVKFNVKWIDSGCVGDYKGLTAVLADFKLIKK